MNRVKNLKKVVDNHSGINLSGIFFWQNPEVMVIRVFEFFSGAIAKNGQVIQDLLGLLRDRVSGLTKIEWILFWTSQIFHPGPLCNAISTFTCTPFWLESIQMTLNPLIWRKILFTKWNFLGNFFFNFNMLFPKFPVLYLWPKPKLSYALWSDIADYHPKTQSLEIL